MARAAAAQAHTSVRWRTYITTPDDGGGTRSAIEIGMNTIETADWTWLTDALTERLGGSEGLEMLNNECGLAYPNRYSTIAGLALAILSGHAPAVVMDDGDVSVATAAYTEWKTTGRDRSTERA